MAKKTRSRSARLLDAVAAHDRAVVLTHNNPDPDAIASGWAIATLIEEKLELPTRLVAGGAIVRAENLRMLTLLRPPLELVDAWPDSPGAALVLVDTSPGAGNHLLAGQRRAMTAVIDHHVSPRRWFKARYRDIRPRLVACSTIAASYLREQGLEPSVELATALMYGLRTDALNNPILTQLDSRIVSWLSLRFDFRLFSEIQEAPLTRQHLAEIVEALELARISGSIGYCFLPHASHAEVIAEVSDFLIRLEGVDRVFCAGDVGDAVLVSVRTQDTTSVPANTLVQTTLARLGQGGGHATKAGGKIPKLAVTREERPLADVLRERWERACGVPPNGWSPVLPDAMHAGTDHRREL